MNASVNNSSDISKHEPLIDAVETGEHHSKTNSISDPTSIDKIVSVIKNIQYEYILDVEKKIDSLFMDQLFLQFILAHVERKRRWTQ